MSAYGDVEAETGGDHSVFVLELICALLAVLGRAL